MSVGQHGKRMLAERLAFSFTVRFDAFPESRHAWGTRDQEITRCWTLVNDIRATVMGGKRFYKN